VVPRPQILIDGLDECDSSSQEQILVELLNYSNTSTRLSKLLILSRDGGITRRRLRQKPTLSLREESKWLQNDISAFITGGLKQARPEWDFPVSESSVTKVEQELLRLSNGTYLMYNTYYLSNIFARYVLVGAIGDSGPSVPVHRGRSAGCFEPITEESPRSVH
jgi:hypothetical protein